MGVDKFCPISLEAGLPPRRSIDLSSVQHKPHGVHLHQRPPASAAAPPAAAGLKPPLHSPQLQHLAACCRSRDVKGLQQALQGAPDCISDAADALGSTVLHLVLMPQAPTAPCSPSVSRSSRSWLPACFGGGDAAASGLTRAASMRSLSSTGALQVQQQMVAALLAAGANANARNMQGQTPLMLAVQQLVAACSSSATTSLVAPALKVLELLCRQPLLDPNAKDNMGRGALHHLCGGFVGDGSHAGAGHAGAATAAAAVAVQGPAAVGAAQLKAVQALLHCGADLNASDKAGMTPLMLAAAQPGVAKDLLGLLLQRGANPRQLDNHRRSALTHALLAQNLRLMPAVGSMPSEARCAACSSQGAAAGAAGEGKDVLAGTRSAGGQQHPEQLLIKASSAAPDAQAAAAGGAGAVLGDASAGSSSACDSCASPDLHAAVHTCSMYSGTTATTTAASCSGSSTLSPPPNPRHGPIVRALCGWGALDLHPASINTRFPGLNGFTQLHIAMRRGDVLALQMLLAAWGDVNATDVWGNTPLMYWPVAPREPAELVEELVGKLLSYGANPNLPNQDGWHALDLACDLNKLGKVVVKAQHVPVHALLVGFGAKNSGAFKAQHRNPPQLLCMRTDSANDVIRNSKGFGSLRAISVQELEHQVAAIRDDTSA